MPPRDWATWTQWVVTEHHAPVRAHFRALGLAPAQAAESAIRVLVSFTRGASASLPGCSRRATPDEVHQIVEYQARSIHGIEAGPERAQAARRRADEIRICQSILRELSPTMQSAVLAVKVDGVSSRDVEQRDGPMRGVSAAEIEARARQIETRMRKEVLAQRPSHVADI